VDRRLRYRIRDPGYDLADVQTILE
jgi:hypothetical protein